MTGHYDHDVRTIGVLKPVVLASTDIPPTFPFQTGHDFPRAGLEDGHSIDSICAI
jgi:hypothetical protein